jgi:hypothetical protein
VLELVELLGLRAGVRRLGHRRVTTVIGVGGGPQVARAEARKPAKAAAAAKANPAKRKKAQQEDDEEIEVR